MSLHSRRLSVVTLSYTRRASPGARPQSESPLAGGVPLTGADSTVQASAVVTGQIVDADPTSLIVTVDGTNVGSAVDALGRFTLHGVPPGMIRLRFTGDDLNGTVTIPGVGIKDEIYVAVKMAARHLAARGH